MAASENMMTVRELAETLNVSKAKINYQCSKIDSQLIVKIKGVNYLTEEAQKLIKKTLIENQVTTQVTVPNTNEQQLKELKNQLAGFDYIEHRVYLDDSIHDIRISIESVLFEEFIEDR